MTEFSMSQIDLFDNLFLQIANHHTNGASQLLDTFANFLGRKTDFFIGGEKGAWEDLLKATFRKHEKISREIHAEGIRKREQVAAELKAKKEREAAKAARAIEQEPHIQELTGRDLASFNRLRPSAGVY